MLDIIGGITPPPAIVNYGLLTAGGLKDFLNNIFRIMIVIGGLWAFFNIIISGYDFLSASGDPKIFAKAWARIWQSMLGVLIMLASFVLAAILGQLLYGDPSAILRLKIYGP